MSAKTIGMTVPEESMHRLETLQSKAGAKDPIEVIKDALRIYEALLDEEITGSIFYIKRPNKEVEPYEIFTTPTTN